MLIVGDISQIKTDVIVNCTDERLDMTGMIASKLINIAGKQLEKECAALAATQKLTTGKCVCTQSYNLPCKEIIHVASPHIGMADANHLLASCYKNALALAKTHNHKSIAFPIISSGGHGYDMEEAIRIAIQRLSVELSNEDFNVYLVLHKNETLNLACSIYERIFKKPYTSYTRFPDPENEIRSVLRRVPTFVYRHLRMNNIIYIDQLCECNAKNLFENVGLNFRMFQRLIQELDSHNYYLSDFTTGNYNTISEYLCEKEKEYIDYCIQREFDKNLKKCDLHDISELDLPGRIITLLHKQNINTVKQLISLTRDDLMAMKQFGVKGVAQIETALISHEILLRGDLMYECEKCGVEFPDVIGTQSRHYCPKCTAKLDRIRNIDLVKITLLEPEYSSFERLSSGFILYANLKNISEELIKVKLKEFYVESHGRQIARKYHLSGYYFDEESIMPNSTRTAAMIWDVDSFLNKKLEEGDYVFITLSLLQEKKDLMYKFQYTEDGMTIEDYFEV